MGSKKAWIAIGFALLLMAVGAVVLMLGFIVGLAPILVGAVLFVIAATYVAYFENWDLLQKKNDELRRAQSLLQSNAQFCGADQVSGQIAGDGYENNYCPSCGEPVGHDWVRCSKCGRKLPS